MARPPLAPHPAGAPSFRPVRGGFAGPVPPRPGLDVRGATLLVLSVAVLTAFAVLVTQLLTMGTGATAYGAVEIPVTGPVVRPDENPLYAIQDVLRRQSAALLRGDRDGYLRAIPAERAELREQAVRRFTSLTALRVRRWSMATAGVPSQLNGIWREPVDIAYCFGADTCAPVDVRVDTRWSVAHGRLQLVGYEQTDRPWDSTALTVKEGTRVTVAAPADEQAVDPAVLDRVLRAAETATGTDDRFATTFDGPPQRYFVYVAGDAEWQRWYDGALDNAAAYTVPLQRGASDVVVDHRSVASDTWNLTLLTHEFAHVVTLGGTAPQRSTWWLTEGIAEYIADGDGSALRNDLQSVHDYLAGGRWDGTVTLGPPAADTSLPDTVARYGIALLTVTYLARRFGEEKMLAFFIEVVRRQAGPESAARSVLGADWPAVAKDAAASVRAAAKAP